MILTFTVPGPVVPWKRTASYQGKRLTPKAQRAYQKRVAWCAAAARPKDWPKNARYRVTVEAHRDGRRFDLGNATKTILDGLNGVTWEDDWQVWELHARRHIERQDPRTEVTVEVMAVDR